MKRLFLVLFVFGFVSCSADKKKQDKEFIEQMERSTPKILCVPPIFIVQQMCMQTLKDVLNLLRHMID